MQPSIQVELDGKPSAGGVQLIAWMLATGVALIAHVILGVFLPSIDPEQEPGWTLDTTILSGVGMIVVLGTTAIVTLLVRNRRVQSSFDLLSWFLTVYSVATMALLLLGALTPSFVIGSAGIVTALATRIQAMAATGVVAGMLGFFVALLRARPSNRLGTYLYVQASLLAVMLLGGLLSVGGNATSLLIVVTALSSIASFWNAPRLPWMQTLPLDKKLRLLWLAGCAAFASILMLIVLYQRDTVLTVATSTLVGGINLVYASVSVVALTIFLRLIVSVVASLPNSTVVDRRSLELESLAELARLTAETATVEDVLRRTTGLTVRVTQAHGAWAELGSGNGASIVATQHVNADYVQALYRSTKLRQLVTQAEKAVVIDALSEHGIDTQASAVRSMVIVPILVDGERCASLVAFMTSEYGFHPDDHRLLAAFGDILSIAIEQSRLQASALERERLQNEADVAREIQTSLLPRTHPSVDGFELHGIMVPASEVGGDYFDYMRFDDGSLGVVIADVAGKGIPAALYMATLKGAVLAEVRKASGPADLLYRLSLTLSGQMDRRSYITMSCVQLRPATSSVIYARAGHSPMLVRTADGVRSVRPKGIAIGLIPPEAFRDQIEEVEIALAEDDVCLLTTDGVTERRNISMQEIGTAPIHEMLGRSGGRSALDIVAYIRQQLDMYAQGADAHDDVTIVAIRSRTATPHESTGST